MAVDGHHWFLVGFEGQLERDPSGLLTWTPGSVESPASRSGRQAATDWCAGKSPPSRGHDRQINLAHTSDEAAPNPGNLGVGSADL